jgi:hypothetical protein
VCVCDGTSVAQKTAEGAGVWMCRVQNDIVSDLKLDASELNALISHSGDDTVPPPLVAPGQALMRSLYPTARLVSNRAGRQHHAIAVQ